MSPFYVLVADHDRSLMAVYGPMTDDTEITGRVFAAQGKGRNINISGGEGCVSRDVALQGAKRAFPHYMVVTALI